MSRLSVNGEEYQYVRVYIFRCTEYMMCIVYKSHLLLAVPRTLQRRHNGVVLELGLEILDRKGALTWAFQ